MGDEEVPDLRGELVAGFVGALVHGQLTCELEILVHRDGKRASWILEVREPETLIRLELVQALLILKQLLISRDVAARERARSYRLRILGKLFKIVLVDWHHLYDQKQWVVHQVVVFKKDRIHFDEPLQRVVLLLVQRHELLVEIPINLHVVEVFEASFLVKLSLPESLVFFWELGCASYSTTLKIKSELIIFLVIWVASVLHYDYVQRLEKLGLDCEDAVDPC